MKRLLLVTLQYPPTRGGIEQVCADVVQSRPPGSVVILTQTAPMPARQDQPDDTIVTFPFFQRARYPSWLPLARMILRLVRERQCEYVLFGHYGPYALVGRWLARRGVPYGLYFHGFDALAYTPRWAHRQLLRTVCREASHIFVNSEWTGRQLEPYCPRWRQAVLHPGVELPASVTPTPANRQLLAVGRFVHIKGYAVAIEALARLLPAWPDVRLTLVGEGPEQGTLERLVHDRRLEGHVTFAGPRAPEQWRRLLATHAALIQPSLSLAHGPYFQEESYGLVAAEAAAAGRPVVATAVGGVPEVVHDGVTGSLVPPNDAQALARAIARLFADPALARQFGEAARRRAETTFSLQHFQTRARRLLDGPAVQPRISVCLPARNAAATLADTIHSLQHQTLPPSEIIVVDDGSTDTTAALAEALPGVTLVRGAHNGASAARNRAAAQATGEFLFFADADCRFAPEALATLTAALDHRPETSFAYSSLQIGWKVFRLQPFERWSLAERNYIPTMALVKRAAFLGFDAGLPRLQDWDLWLRLAEAGHVGIWVDRVLYRTRVTGRGISGGWFPKVFFRIPWLADRLSRGAGLSLREAEALVRQRHPAPKPRPGHPALACPRCRQPLELEPNRRCPVCGLTFRSEAGIPLMLDPDAIDAFKEHEIRAHAPVLAWRPGRVQPRNADYHRWPRQVLQRLPRGSRLLEVACGERPDTLELAQAGYQVTLSDLSAPRVTRALQSAEQLGLRGRVQPVVADAERLPFADGSFDGAYVAASFHHFPDPRRAFHELRRVVRSGGYVIVALEPQRWPYRTLFRWLKPLQHVLRRRAPTVEHSVGDDVTEGFTAASLLALARNEGVHVVSLRPAKVLREGIDQTVRLSGKLLGRTWETPHWISRCLQPIDWVLERLPGTRALAWHWTLITRVP